MSLTCWATLEKALKLVLNGDATKSLSPNQQTILRNMLARSMRLKKGDKRKTRHLPGLRKKEHKSEISKEHETMYYIPDVFMYMVTAFDDWGAFNPPVDLTFLRTVASETEERDDLIRALRKIEIQREMAELGRTSHGGDPDKLETQNRIRAQLELELAEVSEQVEKTNLTRDAGLQVAANVLAKEWQQKNQNKISKRDIAKALAISDDWNHMTSATIERIIRKQW